MERNNRRWTHREKVPKLLIWSNTRGKVGALREKNRNIWGHKKKVEKSRQIQAALIKTRAQGKEGPATENWKSQRSGR